MTRYRWVALALGIGAQAAFAGVVQGLPVLGPALRSEYDLSLSGIGALFGAVILGGTVSLLPWGLVTDRLGERLAISIGLGGAGVALVASIFGGGIPLLATMFLVAGTLGAVTNVASGRVVMSWFEASQRGLAFGLRQAALPFGGTLTALALPALAAGSGTGSALVTLGAVCVGAAAACGLWLRDPSGGRATEPAGRGPLRDRRVYRLAAASAGLVAAQGSMVGFVTLFLNEERGFSPVAAGAVYAVIQAISVAARIAAGRWSDRLGLRLVPLRRVAGACIAALVAVPLLFGAPDAVMVPALVMAGVLTFSWNGLSFTATAEYAGAARSATALAIQQTALFGTAAVVQPVFGALVAATSWRFAFATLAAGPAAGWLMLRPLARAEAAAAVPG